MRAEPAEAGGFEKLIGGRLCLDFVNTLDWRGRAAAEEKLKSYADFIRWGFYAGILDRADRDRLADRAARNQSGAQRALASARRLRELLASLFNSLFDRKQPGQKNLDAFNAYLASAEANSKIDWGEGQFIRHSEDKKESLTWILNPIVRSAAELFVSGEWEKVKRCGDRECGWMYLDNSRNQSRRWCSMEDCGNRAKARRFYSKRKLPAV